MKVLLRILKKQKRRNMNMRDMLLETGGKGVLIVEWQKAQQTCVLQVRGKQNQQVMKIYV